MPTLRPFRDYSQHDVINLFTFSGSHPLNRGSMVKIEGSGWRNSDEPIDMIGAPGQGYNNTVSQRYGLNANISLCGSGNNPLGMTLYDVKETDENGEKLIYNPRKAAEMGVVVSGQAVPVLTRGIVLYSGATLASDNPAAGVDVYVAANGEISTTNTAGTATMLGGQTRVGKVLGGKDDNGHFLLRLEL